MQRHYLIASLLATSLPCQSLLAQASGYAAVVEDKDQAGPQVPVDASDSPEEIAKDAARDLKDNRFYNKPGATRAQYDADWQRCRLIARGSRTPTGSTPTYFYNPAVSPMAGAIGGVIGSAIAAAIAEGQQRRANRRACLLINGWRLVELPPAATARVAAMSDSERNAYFDTIVGADQVEGKITERKSFVLAPDPSLNLEASVTGPASVFLGKNVDTTKAFELGAGEAAIVLTFRRPGESSAGRSGSVSFVRYDAKARDLVYQPKDWKKQGDKTTYMFSANSRDRKSPLEVQVLRVTPGDYVINGTTPMVSNCFGAPTFHVDPGQVVYLGDFTPYSTKLSVFARSFGVAFSSHPEEARQALATHQPALAAAMTPATWRNGATYACSAVTMDRWDLPGTETIESSPTRDQATLEADSAPTPGGT